MRSMHECKLDLAIRIRNQGGYCCLPTARNAAADEAASVPRKQKLSIAACSWLVEGELQMSVTRSERIVGLQTTIACAAASLSLSGVKR